MQAGQHAPFRRLSLTIILIVTNRRHLVCGKCGADGRGGRAKSCRIVGEIEPDLCIALAAVRQSAPSGASVVRIEAGEVAQLHADTIRIPEPLSRADPTFGGGEATERVGQLDHLPVPVAWNGRAVPHVEVEREDQLVARPGWVTATILVWPFDDEA